MKYYLNLVHSRVILFTLLSLAIFLNACSNHVQTEKPIDDQNVIELDPFKLMKDENRRIKASSIIDSISYIPLETTTESEFTDIDKFETVDSLFFIMDSSINSILVFNDRGKFKFSINSTNRGKGHFSKLSNFIIDRDKKEIVLLEPKAMKLLYYDFKGRFIKEIIPGFRMYDFEYVDKNCLSHFRGYYQLKSEKGLGSAEKMNYNLYFTDSSSIVKSCHFPYDSRIVDGPDVIFSSRYYYRSDSSIFFVPPYQYTVYSLQKEEIKPAYLINIPPNNTLPPNFLSDDDYTKKRIKYAKQQPELVFSVNDFYKVGNNVFLNLLLSFDRGFSVFIDLKKQQAFALSKVINDINLYPLGDLIVGSKAQSLFCFAPASSFTSFYSIAKHDKSKQFQALKGIISTIKSDDNPVISRIHLKKN